MKINLLPWREDHIKNSNKKFGMILISVILLAFIFIMLYKVILIVEYKSVQQNILSLQRESSILNTQVKEVSDLIDKQEKFKFYVTRIDKLQQYRLLYPMMLEGLTKVTTENLILRTITSNEKNQTINLKGYVINSEEVSRFISNLEKSTWVDSVVLADFKNINNAAGGMIEFSINIFYKPNLVEFYENK